VTLNETTPREVNWCYFDVIDVLGTAALIIARIHHKGDEIFALSWCYAARGDNSLPNFRDNPLIEFLIIEVETDGLYQNFGKELPSYAAYCHRREDISILFLISYLLKFY